jgi:hypothetical protein
LIGGARQDFYDEWGMDENQAAANLGLNDVPMEEDDVMSKVILESLKTGGGVLSEEEQLRRAIEESKKLR